MIHICYATIRRQLWRHARFRRLSPAKLPLAKHGTTSLKWETSADGESTLRYKLPKSAHIKGKKLRGGGVKMWIYKDTPSSGRKKRRKRLRG
ncbi:hypothetical protein pdam_00013869 [Pocillopora damicornis]|uniref:Uncharacterized protein n=1 Tax=Pocillopora damicornis TaxID=46731 RepID=A0A3M6UL90_POCDA|nr:hypothetical protein pdam_00013869 [Pocillopora damicornis]